MKIPKIKKKLSRVEGWEGEREGEISLKLKSNSYFASLFFNDEYNPFSKGY